MIDAASPLLLAADDVSIPVAIKAILILAVLVISVVSSAIKKGRAVITDRRARDPVDPDGNGGMRPDVLDRVRIPDESRVRPVGRPAGSGRPPAARPAATLAPTGAHAPTARRKGLVDDAHVEVASHLPTSDDMPGAHSAHDHVHLTEIGADRGTAPKHLGAHPTAAATVGVRRGLSGHALLRANDLKGRDRVRAGILWAEVFAPPRSRARR